MKAKKVCLVILTGLSALALVEPTEIQARIAPGVVLAPPPAAPQQVFVPQPTVVAPGWAPAPPMTPVMPIPRSPGRGFVWTPGYYDWNGGWVWTGGRWVRPPRPGAVWMPGRWDRHRGNWRYSRGYWR